MNKNKKLFKEWLLGYLISSENPGIFKTLNLDLEKAEKFKQQTEDIVNFIERYDLVEWKNNSKK